MACRGVHFAIQPEIVDKLLRAESDEDLIDIVTEDIEETWDKDWLHQSDKAWDAIHRCLTDGHLGFNNGPYPLRAIVLGGTQLYQGDDWIISLVEPSQVGIVAEALTKVDKNFLKRGYEHIDASDYEGELGTEDWEYTWSWFDGLSALFSKAAAASRGVVFTVDQ